MFFGYTFIHHAQAIAHADKFTKQVMTERKLRELGRPGRPPKR